ncbi:hypothetical protein [Zobellia russellii]|uniref:hypothetical protein n=1 Tax=Zobellia russellii TaxID=248907 RepID=UPI001BFF1F10|nr:hypothetical protein [Zobellia russellii]MBT9187615.1 hypothetical protein [Zobellia russellii]
MIRILSILILLLISLNGYSQTETVVPQIRFKQYDHQKYNQRVAQKDFSLAENSPLNFQESSWVRKIDTVGIDKESGTIDLKISLSCVSGQVSQSSIGLVFQIDDWHDSNYVLMPGALYNGNKYDYRRIRYSPKLMDPRDIAPEVPIIITDVPRLNKYEGVSEVQLRSGATTSPSISYFDSIQNKGYILLSEQGNALGDFGLGILESRNREHAEFSISSPLVREKHQYFANDNLAPSNDRGADFKAGDTLTFHFKSYSFEAQNVQDLFDKFAMVRKELNTDKAYNNVIPLSYAFETIEKKFKRDNWVPIDDHGYFSVGLRENFLQDFQTGWTGGMISTYPLLFSEKRDTRERVIKNFDWFFPNSTSPSGLFYGFCEGGTDWFGGDKRKYHTKDWLLTRKSADAIFFVLEQFKLMKTKGIPIDPQWEKGIRTACDAFVNIWQTYGQIGQFVDAKTGTIQVGGSSSAGILPAGLVLAADYFKAPNYLDTAKEIGQYFYSNFTEKGISCGGPGDALQNFDSESTYALIESYYSLYEASGDPQWEVAAEEAAKQFSSWVIAYNYDFPEESTFGKLGNHSIGGVWANTQNTHGSPGICTHSGLALLKLFRSTGKPFYAELLSDITHAIPQCLSVPSRKIMDAPDGWMSERLSTTDWNEGIGEIFVGSTWAETALMLTYTEIPGIYVCAAKSEVISFDNLTVEILKDTPKYIKVKVKNPTQMEAKVKIWEEDLKERQLFLETNYLLKAKPVTVPQQGHIILTFKK